MFPGSALIAQVAVGPADSQLAACGPTEDAGSVCLADNVLVRPAKIVLIFAVAWFATRLLRRAVTRFVKGMQGEGVGRRLGSIRERAPSLLAESDSSTTARRALRAGTIGSLLRSVASLTIWTVAVLMALAELGLNLGPLIAGAGIIGVAVGFGAQNLVRDVVSGVFMLLEDQYGVGDVIDAGPATGTVEALSLRTTRLRDVEGVVWHIPSGELARFGNKSQQWSRAVLDVEVAYSTNVDHATEVIKGVADRLWQDQGDFAGLVLEEPEVWGVERLGADSIAIRLVVKTEPLKQWKVSRELRARIKAAFEEVGIEIPQRVVWHRTDEAAAARVPVGVGAGTGRGDGDRAG